MRKSLLKNLGLLLQANGLLTLIPLFLSLDLTILKKDKKYYNDLFSFILIITILFLLLAAFINVIFL